MEYIIGILLYNSFIELPVSNRTLWKSRVANRPLFQRIVLYLNPRPCPLLNLELSFISRAEKNLLQERKKLFAKVQSNRGCVAQPMENHVREQYFYMVASKKKKKVNT